MKPVGHLGNRRLTQIGLARMSCFTLAGVPRRGQAKAETDAKIQSLRDQAKQAGDRAKRRIDKRIAEVNADFEVRSRKLNQAWNLTKQALAA